MNRTATTSLLATAALAVLAAPAAADKPADTGRPGPPAQAQGPGPGASPSAKAQAYGRQCQGTSKRKAEGQDKSPFALCVTALARSRQQGEDDAEKADGPASYATRKRAARAACKAVPKRKLPGARKTQFALCVTAAAKLRREAAAPAG